MTPPPPIGIRPYIDADWAAIWAVLRPVFRAGETYAIARDIDADAARAYWTAGATTRAWVAVDADGETIVGTYYLRANQAGPGAHVCNAGYVVADAARGRGVATALCEHSLAQAQAAGFRAMQYNLVAASNAGAVRLWKRMGFSIVGTLPGAFAHPRLGDVDAHIMHRPLGHEASTSPATNEPAPAAVDLDAAFSRFDERWAPRIVAALNDQHVKVAKFEGEFVWHRHEVDELFLVTDGAVDIHLRSHVVRVEAGQCYVVPGGVEHKPVAPTLAHVVLIEPATTVNTGDRADSALTVAAPEWL